MIRLKLKYFFALTLLSCCLLWTSCQSVIGGSHAEPVKAIPENAAFIVKINKPARFTERLAEKPYGAVMNGAVIPPSLMANHHFIASFLQTMGVMDSSVDVTLLASLHLASANALNSIHYYPVDLNAKAFSKELDVHFPAAARQTWNYEGVDIHEVLLSDIGEKVTVAFSNGLLIASPVSFLVEDAIKQLKSNRSIDSDEAFRKVYRKETDAADGNLWISYKHAKHWLGIFVDPDAMSYFEGLERFASWSLLDIYLNDTDLFLSGITSTANGDYLHNTQKGLGCDHAIDQHAPLNSASYQHFAGHHPALVTAMDSIGLGMSSCWSRILVEPLIDNLEEHILYLLPTVEQTLDREAASAALMRLYPNADQVYLKELDDFLVVASNESVLNNYVRNQQTGKVLAGDETFTLLKEELKAEAQATSYFRSLYLKEAFDVIYEDDGKEAFANLRAFNQTAIQFSRQGDIFQTTATITYDASDVGGQTNLAWTANLDAPVMVAPVMVTLDESGKQGVLVQDTDFNMYLLNKSGNAIWKRNLGSKWMGSAFDIHLYEASAHQISFNTETDWYLVNGEGDDMAGFPLQLKDNASAPMSMTAHDDDHVIFIPSVNGNLYGWELSGRPLPGWNPKEKTGVIQKSVQLYSKGEDLYVSAINEDGMAYIWRADGKKLSGNAFKTNFPSAQFIDKHADPFKIKNVKQDGELVSMNRRGRVGRYKLPVSGVDQFVMHHVAGDVKPEIILSTSSRLYVFSYTGELQWKKDIGGPFTLTNDEEGKSAWIGVYDQSRQSFTVFDGDGNEMLETDFFVGKHILFDRDGFLGEGQAALITSGDEQELKCYRVAPE